MRSVAISFNLFVANNVSFTSDFQNRNSTFVGTPEIRIFILKLAFAAIRYSVSTTLTRGQEFRKRFVCWMCGGDHGRCRCP